MKNKEKLTFIEELENAIGCMEYWEKRVGEYVMELNENSLSEDECVMEATQKSLEFIKKLPEIVYGACVLAVYAGEDWASDEYGYGFGADSYEYCDKYVEGGMELADVFGTEDFHNDFYEYFEENICPNPQRGKDEEKEEDYDDELEEGMKSITVYDFEADELEKIADENDTTVAEVVELLMEYADQMKEDNGWK